MNAMKFYNEYLEEVEKDNAIIEAEKRAEAERAEAEAEYQYEREARATLNQLWQVLTTSSNREEVLNASDLYSDLYKDLYGFRPRYYGENYKHFIKEN